MSDYTQSTFFAPKDLLATGNPNKIIYGSDVDAELSAISTAIATKADVNGDAIGAGTPCTEINVDNLKLDGNKITSTNTDGDIELEPDGTGIVTISSDVGIGTASPSELLEIASATSTTTAYSLFSSQAVDRLKVGYAFTETPTSSDVFGMAACNADGDLLLAARGNATANIEMYTAGAERMRITSSGNVGIGTASPATLLHLEGGSASPELRLSAASLTSNLAQFKLDVSNSRVVTASSSLYALAFDVNSAERLRIDSSGKVGIGTTSPDQKLHLSQNTASTKVQLRVENESATSGAEAELALVTAGNNFGVIIYPDADASNANRTDFISTASDSYFTFSPNSAEAMRIDDSGRLLVGKTTAISSISSIEADGSVLASGFFSGDDSASLANNTATTVLDLAQTGFRNTVLRVKSYDAATHTMGVADVFVNWNGGTYVVALDQIYSGQNTSEFTLSGTNLQFRHTFGSTRNITTVWQVV